MLHQKIIDVTSKVSIIFYNTKKCLLSFAVLV